MDTKTIYTRLNKVFRDVFDDDSITVNPKKCRRNGTDHCRPCQSVNSLECGEWSVELMITDTAFPFVGHR